MNPGTPQHRLHFPDMDDAEYISQFRCDCGRGWKHLMLDECYECSALRAKYPGCELLFGMRVSPDAQIPTCFVPNDEAKLIIQRVDGDWVIVGVVAEIQLMTMDADGVIRDAALTPCEPAGYKPPPPVELMDNSEPEDEIADAAVDCLAEDDPDGLNGHYLVCPNIACGKVITKRSEFEFVNVEEDPQGRDLITFTCKACGHNVKSFAFIGT